MAPITIHEIEHILFFLFLFLSDRRQWQSHSSWGRGPRAVVHPHKGHACPTKSKASGSYRRAPKANQVVLQYLFWVSCGLWRALCYVIEGSTEL